MTGAGAGTAIGTGTAIGARPATAGRGSSPVVTAARTPIASTATTPTAIAGRVHRLRTRPSMAPVLSPSAAWAAAVITGHGVAGRLAAVWPVLKRISSMMAII